MELTLGRPGSHDGSHFIHRVHEDHIIPKFGEIKAYMKSLEEEHRKIEAFKRELPICMQLLRNEIKASREQLCDCVINEEMCTPFESLSPPKANSMIPRRLSSRFEEPNNCESLVGDGNWASSRLSTPSWIRDEVDISEDQEEQAVSAMAKQLYRTRPIGSYERDLQSSSHVLRTRPGGAFVPFHKDSMRKPLEEATEMTSPSHAHHQDAYPSTYFSASNEGATASKSSTMLSSEGASYQEFNEPFPPANNGILSQLSPHRKPRRYWSAELHRKFVHALKQLGGSEVATPKQIREIMQVDGLTNDEIKSHLQKYRLHTKRPNPMCMQPPNGEAAQAPTATPQLVVLGGIWVPPEYLLKQSSLDHPLYYNLVPDTYDTRAAPI